ncbi:MAG: ParB/RepB/Spo0J family partition protein [Planctomycetaceae bacterium]|nr:ParB/RepB/Spo0J family partition protein [Planctomycetaceae bacterium]MCA9064593.1 ParB/RepB/Spo0J family partition protein [Planctomycetaceae bacterium]
MRVEQIATSLITPDVNQPRLSIEPEPLKELALSIRELGVLQPLIVFQHEDGFCLVDGHRRHAAANLLKLASIPAMVLPSRPDGDQLLLTQMAANCMRVDLKPTEKAIAYLRLKKSRNWSHADLAQAMHISKATVTQTLSYLSLPDEAKAKLDAGELSGSTAYAISRESDPEAQRRLLQAAMTGKLRRDDVSARVSRRKNGRQRSVFRVGGAEVTMSVENDLGLADYVTILQQLISRCRRAEKEGLSVSTLERMMSDVSGEDAQAPTTEPEAAECDEPASAEAEVLS